MVYLAIGGVILVTVLVILGEHSFRSLVREGKCPTCAGMGDEFVNMNGLEGCIDCNGLGTLEAHNEWRQRMRMRPLRPK